MDVLSTATTYGEVNWRRKDAPGGSIKVVVMGNQLLKRAEVKEVKKVEKAPQIIDVSLFSILKSNLQKQVRLRDECSVTTAAAMWEANIFELLRRIPIIAFEDSIPTVELVVVVWMMCVVSKGYELEETHREWILDYVHRLTLTEECMYRSLPKDSRFREELPLNAVSPMDTQREFMLCMLFRCSYGGLKHDPHMIMGMLNTHRLQRHKMFQEKLQPIEKDGNLPPIQILSSAVDFHCYPGIVNQILARYKQYDEGLLKKTIWECSSSTNSRVERPIDKVHIDVWNDIREYVYALILLYIERVYSEEINKRFIKRWLSRAARQSRTTSR